MRDNKSKGSDLIASASKNAADTAAPNSDAVEVSRKITNFGQTRKRNAKLRTLDESRALAGLAQSLGCDFVAIGELLLSPSISSPHTKLIKDTIRSWLKTRYWGEAMILSDTHYLPPPDSLPSWKALPAEVAQFFKLLFVLEHSDAVFVTIRLDPDIGDRALEASRGPCDWLAERIVRALDDIGVVAEHIAFSIEFAPRQARTLHRLHIHGAVRISADLRILAVKALKEALAPGYTTHGKNQAVKFEEARNTADVARYAPKEAALKTEYQINAVRGARRGSSAHRSSQAATAGGRRAYESLNQLLYGNQYGCAGLPDFS